MPLPRPPTAPNNSTIREQISESGAQPEPPLETENFFAAYWPYFLLGGGGAIVTIITVLIVWKFRRCCLPRNTSPDDDDISLTNAEGGAEANRSALPSYEEAEGDRVEEPSSSAEGGGPPPPSFDPPDYKDTQHERDEEVHEASDLLHEGKPTPSPLEEFHRKSTEQLFAGLPPSGAEPGTLGSSTILPQSERIYARDLAGSLSTVRTPTPTTPQSDPPSYGAGGEGNAEGGRGREELRIERSAETTEAEEETDTGSMGGEEMIRESRV